MTGYLTTADVRAANPCLGGLRRWLRAVREGGHRGRIPLTDEGAALMAKHGTTSDFRWLWRKLVGSGETDIVRNDDASVLNTKIWELAIKVERKRKVACANRVAANLWATALVAGLKAAYPDE